MFTYYIMLPGLTVLGIALCFFKRNRTKDGIFLLISFAVLSTLSAIRYDVGFDYSYIYAPIYHGMLTDTTGEFWEINQWEPGFRLLLSGMMQVSFNFQTVFIVTSVLIVGLVMIFFWFFSPNPAVSVFLFITLSHYYCTMNFVRQSLAAAVAMFAFPLLKKLISGWDGDENTVTEYIFYAAGYFGIVLLASTFHMSALLLIPFFFINLIPINKISLPIYVAITAVIYFNTEVIMEFVTRFWYTRYYADSIHAQVGFSPQFSIAAAGLFVLLFVFVRLLKRGGEGNRLYVNYAFFAFFFILMGTRHSIVDRLSMNFVFILPVGVAIVVNELFKNLHEKVTLPDLRKRMAALVAVLFTVAGGGLTIHHYALVMDHHGVVPYQVIFTQPFYREYVAHLRTLRLGLLEPVRRVGEPQLIQLQRPQLIHHGGGLFVPDAYVVSPFEVTIAEFIELTDMEG